MYRLSARSLIEKFYSNRESARSKVPLINHINEGLIILDHLGESVETMNAFCLHPMIQNDPDLAVNWGIIVHTCDAKTVMLAMEYRSVANEFLSPKVNDVTIDKIRLSPLTAVNNMLIADKIQNRKDFELYHRGTHPRSAELEKYFNMWLSALSISENKYTDIIKLL